MNEIDKTFRDRLLDMEKPKTTYKQKYEREIQAVFEKKLNYLGRAGCAGLAIIGLLLTVWFGGPVFSKVPANEVGFFIRVVTVPGLVLALVWTFFMGWIAATGKLNLRTQPARMAGVGTTLGFLVVAAWMFIFVVPITVENPVDWRSIFGIQIVIIGFFLVVVIGLYLTLRILYRVEFKTREELLKIEYRIAELAEKIEGKSDK
jgi:hypothetical protein